MRPIRCAKEQSERIYIAGVMSDCHPMNGSVRLHTYIGWVRTLQVAYLAAPPMPDRVILGRRACFCRQNSNPSTSGTLVATCNRVPLLHRNADRLLLRKVGIKL